MTSVDRFEASIAEWLDAESAYHLPDHLGEVVAQTAVTRQRPAWSSLERWLPMQSTLRFAPAPRLGLIALLALAILAVVGIAMLATGSRRVQLAPPTGLARNGPMAYDKAGDIYRYDPATAVETVLITNRQNDTAPLFSRDGGHVLFSRGPDGANPTSVLVADADGRNVHEVIGQLTDWTWGDWSPDGARVAFGSSIAGTPSITIANADGSGSTVLDVGMPATFPSWAGPDGTDVLFRGNGSGGIGLFLVKADGSSSPRPVPGAPASGDALYQDPVVSLDGTHVAYSSFESSTWQPATGARTPGWDGNLLEVHVLELATGHDVLIPPGTDPLVSSQPVDESLPVLSPDGRMVVLVRDRSDGKGWLAVAPSDGSAPGHQVGVDFAPVDGEQPMYEFSPDATMVIASYPSETISHLLPVAGGPGTTAPRSGSGASDMQRLAP